MKFTPGLWQHRNCTDLQLQIVKVQFQGPKYTKVKALYVRKDFGSGSILMDPKADSMKIVREQYNNWRRVG